MSTRKPPSDFTIERGRLIRRAREEAGWSQDRLAQQFGIKSREGISQLEAGKIHKISERGLRVLVQELGLLPENLLEDPSMFQFSDEAKLPPMSNEARRVARRWDSIPQHMRALIIEAINADERSKKKPPPRAAKK